MSNKKDENKWLQVGNFLLGVDTNVHGSYVVCKAVSGGWSIRWKDEQAMFAMMLQLMKRAAEDANVREYLHSLVSVWFVTTTNLHDLIALSKTGAMPFCEGVIKLLKEQNEYETSVFGNKEVSADEDAQALHEVVEKQEIEDELEKLDKENG